MKKIVSLLVIIVCAQWSCTKDDTQVCADKKELKLNVAQGNITEATIGRVMFYDTRLSSNNSISCASCHKQAHGFADDEAFSAGFQGHRTSRNSIAITSSNFILTNGGGCGGGPAFSSQALFWDGRESLLNTMVIKPILNHVEMGLTNSDQIVDRVSSAGYYHELFSQLYGNDEITLAKISDCITAFVSQIQNGTSKFDQVLTGQTQFDALEQQGADLFFNIYPCGSCHQAQSGYNTITSTEFVDIGLDDVPLDQGRAGVTHLSSDVGKFKVPTLKNVANTAPYMHDGRFSSLEDVIDHYSHGIRNDQNLDPRLKNQDGTPLLLNITDQQKRALVAFLTTFSDFHSMSSEELSDPFKH